MSESQYVEKVSKLLGERKDYERVTETTTRLDDATRHFVVNNIADKLPEKLEGAVKPHHLRMPQFYGLPKDHKPGMPVRPVVSTCGSLTSNMSLVLERILDQLLPFVPAHLSSTSECIGLLKENCNVPEDCIIASRDIVGLYTNIPIPESIDAAVDLLRAPESRIDMLGLSVEDIHSMVEFVLDRNYFEFNGEQYRQRNGLAMGNRLAPPLAIIFMSSLEVKVLDSCDCKPLLYKRYIDDIFVIKFWCHGREAFDSFVQLLNAQHPRIRFTVEHSDTPTHSISFLDLTVSVSNCTLDWELSINPSHSDVHVSSIPFVYQAGGCCQPI